MNSTDVALTLMMVYLWVAPIQLLHFLYRCTRRNRHKKYYTDLAIYATLAVCFFIVLSFYNTSPIGDIKLGGDKIRSLYLIITPGLIASYYTYTCFKKYPATSIDKTKYHVTK